MIDREVAPQIKAEQVASLLSRNGLSVACQQRTFAVGQFEVIVAVSFVPEIAEIETTLRHLTIKFPMNEIGHRRLRLLGIGFVRIAGIRLFRTRNVLNVGIVAAAGIH